MKIVRVFVTEDWGFSLETAVYVLQYNHVQCCHGFSGGEGVGSVLGFF